MIAAEDIVTPDGTVRAAAGEVVDTITTDEEGKAETKELYLGKYQIVEKTAPEGLVLNTETHEVELTYAGQEVSVTEADTAFYNERQKVTVDLTKTLEQDEIFGIGNAGEIQNVAFGLYAAEDLTAADGSVIPADGLIEIVFCNAEGDCRISDRPAVWQVLCERSCHGSALSSVRRNLSCGLYLSGAGYRCCPHFRK